MGKEKVAKRSPLKAPPLRNPAQSLDEEISRVLEDEVLIWILYPVFFAFFVAMEWYRWFVPYPPHPIAGSLLVIGLVGFSATRLVKARKKIAALKLGRDGEKEVGQYLDGLREKGYRVFHDLLGKGFNVDHVIISPHGVFVVETKTYSKPHSKEATVRLDGTRLTVNGHLPDRDPVEQVKGQARWVHEVLKESTGKDYKIRPAIVFPGWFVEPIPKGSASDVWVLNPKALPTFIENSPVVLPKEDLILAAYSLSRYIRSSQ